MYEIIKPSKFSIYTTTKGSKLNASQVRTLTGADIVINGTLYNVNTWKPVCDVKKDGVILSNDKYTYWGYGWNPLDKRMVMCNNIITYDNYITCVALMKDGKDVIINANPDVARAAGRTAIGFKENGSMVVWCTGEGVENMTLTTLRNKMRNLGCVDALALDGGGSSQLSQAGTRYVYSSRKVQNYICIWKESVNTPTINNQKPTRTIKKGDSGNDVLWVQKQLNKNMKIPETGKFDTVTSSAVTFFQKINGLVADGIVGVKTIAKLE